MPESDVKIASPCVSLCCLDEDDVCLGCLRHLDEITGWHSMDDTGKRELLAKLKERRASAGSPGFPR